MDLFSLFIIIINRAQLRSAVELANRLGFYIIIIIITIIYSAPFTVIIKASGALQCQCMNYYILK